MAGTAFLGTSLILAARGRIIQKLMEGDPVAWSIVGGVAVISIIGVAIKARSSRSSLDK